ncbi:hypothetical protein CB599_11685 [Salmonella enterica subsp. enterica serovar Adjame]|nr:hypothetical protein [Salmonella enterica subsp. enterica serovar Adjame]
MSFLNNIGHFIQHSGIDVVKSSVKRPLEAGKDLIHGHPGKAFQDLRHIVSDNEKAQSKGFGDIGIHGWVGKHPLESAAAVVATIFGGWAAWGAYGAGAAGSAAGAAGTAGGTAGSGVAAGTMIGQTVPMTPGMIGAAAGQGSAIGVGGSAAANAAAASTAPSFEILSGASSSGVAMNAGTPFVSHLGGEAEIGNTGGISGSTVGSSWQDWARDANRVNNMVNQGSGSKEQGDDQKVPKLRHDLLNSFMQDSPNQIKGIAAPAAQPQTTTQLLGSTQIGGGSFSNNFGS